MPGGTQRAPGGSQRVPKGGPGGSQCSQRRQLHSFKVPRSSQRRLLHSLKVPKGNPEAPKTTVTQCARSQRVRKGPQVAHNAPRDDSCTVSRLPRLPKTTVAQFREIARSNWKHFDSRDSIKTRSILHKFVYRCKFLNYSVQGSSGGHFGLMAYRLRMLTINNKLTNYGLRIMYVP